MVHLPVLIQDLAFILAAAGIVTLLFKRLKQPVVLGYIIAGLIVGPHFPLLPSVSDVSSIQIWAEIGVIFLLFALGLEFSFKKLARVGAPASTTAIVEALSMVFFGFMTGKLFGWSNMDSIFLGGVLSVSSTTIIIRAFDELGVKGRGFVSLVFGVLIVEDLIAILIMVLLSTVAISQTFAGSEMMVSIVKLLFFLTLWFIAGIFLLPTFLKRAKSLMNDETLLVVSVALCLVMVVLATQAGFSAALGAFIMGSILAETAQGEKIEHLIQPVKDLFAAVFFVSVGMLIDPAVLFEYTVPVIVITLVTIVGKLVSSAAGALLAGQSLRHAVQSGMSLAQIGEFSFIIATLGMSLKVTSEFLYPIVVGVSAVTTFTTPYLIKSADRVHASIESAMPKSWLDALSKYSAASQSISTRGDWTKILQSYLMRLGLHSVMITAIFLGVSRFLSPVLSRQLENPPLANAAGLTTALLFSAPFLWALLLGKKSRQLVTSELWQNPRFRGPILVLEASRWVVALLLFTTLSAQFVTFTSVVGIFLIVTILSVFAFSRHLSKIYARIESRFFQNLSEKDLAIKAANQLPALAPWDAHLVRIEIPAESDIVGRTLADLGVRERFGITIALIERGQRRIAVPSRMEALFPFDKVLVIGTDDQILNFQNYLKTPATQPVAEDQDIDYKLQAVTVDENSPFCGRSIRESGIREKSKGLVVGIERKDQRILNPDSQVEIEAGDLLWIVGDVHLTKNLIAPER